MLSTLEIITQVLLISRFNENTATINHDHKNFNTQSLSNNIQNNF